jgi:hypothetical protein
MRDIAVTPGVYAAWQVVERVRKNPDGQRRSGSRPRVADRNPDLGHGPRKGFVTNGATIAPNSSPMTSVTRICREIMASRRRSTSPVDWSAASSILC